ncbi:MAG: hypothetical protein ACI865_003033 [Flavobacteriaceae bacterium]|jgi:hypothetical protein
MYRVLNLKPIHMKRSQRQSTVKITATFIAFIAFALGGFSQDSDSPFVNFEQFEALVKEVKEHRSDRMLGLDEFNKASSEENTIILDTRSKSAYDAMHIKGAIHLNFSDFTQVSLDELLASRDVRILIYCNNNIEENPFLLEETEEFFPSKMASPVIDIQLIDPIELDDRGELIIKEAPITLALNIPTYINLYGYGYKNVYELKDLVMIGDQRLELEGTEVASVR